MNKLLNSFNNSSDIIYLKKKEFDIFYSCKYKYPLLTVEKITKKSGKTEGEPIKRKNIKDPFKVDTKLPKECRLKLKNIKDYMVYGGSPGHQAPAGHHKTNMKVYSETFLLSNIAPQEMCLNSGLWVLLETWVLGLKNDSELENVTVFTGCIPDSKTQTFLDTTLNVPTHWFKIVTASVKNEPNTLYIACFLMNNSRPSERIFKLYKYLVSLKELSMLANINFFQLFEVYSNFKKQDKIHSLKHKVRIDLHFGNNRMLIKQMNSSFWYGELIYSTTLLELERKWKKTKQNNFGDEYHEIYYKYAKMRLSNKIKKKTKKYKFSSKNKTSKSQKTQGKTKIKSQSKKK